MNFLICFLHFHGHVCNNTSICRAHNVNGDCCNCPLVGKFFIAAVETLVCMKSLEIFDLSVSVVEQFHAVLAALWHRADHYIFTLWFVLSSSFFPRLISAVADWMSAILPHMVWS